MSWCDSNKLLPNFDKCKFASVSRIYGLNFDYKFNYNYLRSKVNVIKDLGVLFDSVLSFGPDISKTIHKAEKLWYFVVDIGKICSVLWLNHLAPFL